MFFHIRRANKRGGGERPPLPFFKNCKKNPDFGKAGPDCIYLCVKFSIQNVVLGVSRRKILFFFIEVPKFHQTSLALKSASLRPRIPFTSLELLSTNAQNSILVNVLKVSRDCLQFLL